MKGFETPQPVSPAEISFGGNIAKLMPEYSVVPEEFKRSRGYWVDWQSDWFFNGLDKDKLPTPKEGIDLDMAMRHLAAIQRSFQPKHEHKQAAVAYLASLWFVTP